MKDGIYYVVFRSNQADAGNGTVVVKDGVINGGDFGYVYQGKIEGGKVKLHVKQHDPKVPSVFPGVTSYSMSLSIEESPGGYVLSGAIDGYPQARLSVGAKYTSALA